MRHAWIIALMGIGGLVLLSLFMVPALQTVADNQAGLTPLRNALIEEFSLESAVLSASTPEKDDPVVLTIHYVVRRGDERTDDDEAGEEMRDIGGYALENLPEQAPELEKIGTIVVIRRQVFSEGIPDFLNKTELINPHHPELGNPYDFSE